MIGTAVQQVGLSNNVMLQVAEVVRDRFTGGYGAAIPIEKPLQITGVLSGHFEASACIEEM